MRRRLVTLSLIVAIALIATGCGGGDGEDTVTASPLTKAEFIGKADEICARDRRKIAKELETYPAKQGSGEGKDQEDLLTEAIREVFLPSLQAKVDEIRALGAPAGDEQQVEAFLNAMQDAIDAMEERSIETLGQFAVQLEPAGELARAYGFNACGAVQ